MLWKLSKLLLLQKNSNCTVQINTLQLCTLKTLDCTLRASQLYAIPPSGTLRLDYVCYATPPPGEAPASEPELRQLLGHLRAARIDYGRQVSAVWCVPPPLEPELRQLLGHLRAARSAYGRQASVCVGLVVLRVHVWTVLLSSPCRVT